MLKQMTVCYCYIFLYILLYPTSFLSLEYIRIATFLGNIKEKIIKKALLIHYIAGSQYQIQISIKAWRSSGMKLPEIDLIYNSLIFD